MARTKGALGKWKPEILLSNKEKLQRKAVQLALAGNETCLRICMDRLYPKLRNEAFPINVKTKSSNIASQGAAIVEAGLSGRITPDVLKDLLSALGDLARLKEFTEIEERLQKLEGHKEAAPWEENAERDLLPIRGKRRRKENAIED